MATSRKRMRSLIMGEVFYINGERHVVSVNPHLSSVLSEYIVFDENGEAWFETDFPE